MMSSVIQCTHFCASVLTARTEENKNGKAVEAR